MPKLRIAGVGRLLPVLALLSAGACEPTSTSPLAVRSADRAVGTSQRLQGEPLPLRMSGSGYFAGQEFAPDFGPPDFRKSLFDGRCSVPSDFVIRFSVEGQLTHLGRVTADFEHCSQVDFATGASAISDGAATWTAANGDELWDRYASRPSAPGAELHQFIGGTGRFVGATGEAIVVAVCDRTTGTCDLQLEGEITYDASNRSES